MVLLLRREGRGPGTDEYVITEVKSDNLEEYWQHDSDLYVFEERFDTVEGLAAFLKKHWKVT